MIPEKKLKHEIQIPQGLKAAVTEDGFLTVEGPQGKVSKLFTDALVKITVEGDKIKLTPKKFTKNEKMTVNTYRAHVRNMIEGVQKQYVYKLKICSSHFPMTATVESGKVVVKNFFGEKVPRVSKILPNVKVTVAGDTITVQGSDKEAVSQTAANIEQSTRVTNRDRRVFADGVWITEKCGEPLR